MPAADHPTTRHSPLTLHDDGDTSPDQHEVPAGHGNWSPFDPVDSIGGDMPDMVDVSIHTEWGASEPNLHDETPAADDDHKAFLTRLISFDWGIDPNHKAWDGSSCESSRGCNDWAWGPCYRSDGA